MDKTTQVLSVAQFVRSFLPKRHLGHLLPPPLGSNASLLELATFSYHATMSVAANFQTWNACSDDVLKTPVRAIVQVGLSSFARARYVFLNNVRPC